MYTIIDIASWFLSKESMRHKKLQKLCYYAQAWGLVLYNRRLINSCFEAWVHGPVAPDLFQMYKDFGWQTIPLTICTIPFDDEALDVLENVWYRYGHLDGEQLEAIARNEQPWQEQRIGLQPQMPGYGIISEDTMRSFYGQQMIEERDS